MQDSTAIVASVVLPCLNERNTVGKCVTAALDCLHRLELCGEVVVADNGSSDGSDEIAAAAGARVVYCPQRGYGAAVQGGIVATQGKVIVMADADDSYDLDQLQDFIEPVRRGEADMVIGNRFAGGIEPGAMPLLNRYLGNPALSSLLRILFGGSVKDAHCGLRSFSRTAFQRMAPQQPGMELASELVVRGICLGMRVLQVPTTLRAGVPGRKPHLRPWRDGLGHVRYMLSERLRIRRIILLSLRRLTQDRSSVRATADSPVDY